MTNRLQRLYRQICTVCLVSTLLLCSLVSYAAEETIVGKVVKVTGEVTASANGSTRPLTRGVDLFVGDTITTSANGYAQLRLTDDAIIALKADTVFEISDYSFQAAFAPLQEP